MNSDDAAQKAPLTFSDLLVVLFSAGGLAGGVILALKSPEAEMQIHGVILAAAAILTLLAGLADGASRTYSDNVVKGAVVAAIIWGVAGVLASRYIAWESAFGRLHSLQNSTVIFAFGGNVLLALSFYVVQRTSRARLYGRFAPWFVFIGFNTMLAMTGATYVLGFSEGKEFIPPEWDADFWFSLVLVMYLFVFVGTIWRSKEPGAHVGNWFFIVFVVIVTVLHIGNNASAPVSLLGSKNYALYSGVQDAITQWWRSHWW